MLDQARPAPCARCLPHSVAQCSVERRVRAQGHRIYGPVRLRRLLANFTLAARVWANTTVVGGFEAAGEPPTLWADDCHNWQHQQVLVAVRKPAAPA